MKTVLPFPPAAPAPASCFRFSVRASGSNPSAIREILKVTESPEIISFAGGLPAPELFPVAAMSRAAQVVLAEDGPAALQYGITEGHPALRAWVADYLQRTVGLTTSPEQILITTGSQQALDLIAKVLLDPGDIVLAENPAYLGALQVFHSYQARVVGLDSDDEGLRPDALERFLRAASPSQRPKLLYLVTNFQNPTGITTSPERRRAVVALAAEFGLPVLEDDPYGQLRYSGTACPALAALPGTRGCLYLGTASKIIAPGLRVAWAVVPDRAMYQKLVVAKQSSDLHTSSFGQRMVERYVREPGVLDAHVASVCTAYARRRNAMLAALEAGLPPGCTWTRPDGGLFLWVRLPEPIDATQLLIAAMAEKVAFVPGEPFWIGPPVRSTLRLNFSNASEAKIAEGIARLGRVVTSAIERPGP